MSFGPIDYGRLAEKLREELRYKDFVPVEPPFYGAKLKEYASKLGADLKTWGHPYALFNWKGSPVALVGRLPSGLYDVEERRWLWVEERVYYEPIGGVAVNEEAEVVAWSSWNTTYVFLWDGSKVRMVDLGEKVGGNIVVGEDGNFYVYGNAGNLYRVTPAGVVTKVSTNPAHAGATCWMAERLGSKLFFPTPYPDRSLYMYDLDTGTWSTVKAFGGTAHDPWFAYVKWATWDTLMYSGTMVGYYRRQHLVGFIAEWGGALHADDYGVLPYAGSASPDVWNFSVQPVPLDEINSLHWVNGILWKVGHPSHVWSERPPNVQPLGAFPKFTCGLPWRGGLLLGMPPLFYQVATHGGMMGVGHQRYGGVLYVKPHELFSLRLPPAKAVFWHNKSISANEVSFPLVTEGWREVTIVFRSDTAGDLTVEVDPDGRADEDGWEEYIKRTSTTKEILTIDEHFARIRLKFSAAATVTAKAHLVP